MAFKEEQSSPFAGVGNRQINPFVTDPIRGTSSMMRLPLIYLLKKSKSNYLDRYFKCIVLQVFGFISYSKFHFGVTVIFLGFLTQNGLEGHFVFYPEYYTRLALFL
jgi:hypothetical protein